MWASDVDWLIAFAVGKSGGVEGHFLHSLKAFHSQFVHAGSRRVPGPVFGALADMKQPYCAYAILQAAYACPAVKVVNGVCAAITPTMVDKQKKPDQQKALDLAESVLVSARSYFSHTESKGLATAADHRCAIVIHNR